MNARTPLAVAGAFLLGTLVGPTTGLADDTIPAEPEQPAACVVVSQEQRLIDRHTIRWQHHRPIISNRVRIVTATTTQCGEDFDTRITVRPIRRSGILFR